MTYANLSDVEDQLRSGGLLLETARKPYGGTPAGSVYVESSKSIRCDVSGEKRKQTGSYRLHELRLDDGIYISGCWWTTGSDTPTGVIELRKTCTNCGHENPLKGAKCGSCGESKFKARVLTPEQKAAHKARVEQLRKQAEAERAAEIEKAATWAKAVWALCFEARIDEHDYFKRKRLSQTGGARIFPGVGGLSLPGAEDDDYKYLNRFAAALVIPICNARGDIQGLQFILSREKHAEWIKRNERDKNYWPLDFDKSGHYWLIGGTPSGVVIVAEGYATGLSIHEATGLPVALAFAANQQQPVGEALRKRYKRTRVLYCADDDWLQVCKACGKYTPVATATCTHCGQEHLQRNAGVYFATAAALATDGAWIVPTFATRPDNRKGPTDFNDLHAAEGLQIVRAQIEDKLDALGWRSGASAPRPAAVVSTEGGGEKLPLAAQITIDAAAERFALVYGGKGTLFDVEEHALVPKSDVLDILPPRAWDDLKKHPSWRAVRLSEVGFDPGGTDPTIRANLWGGWPTEPKEGTCTVLLELLEYLCSGEQNAAELYQWVLKWLAYPIQHPGAKMRTALVFHGPQGTGKNLFFEAVMAIYGEYGRIVDQSAVEDKFNDWASRKLFMIADEVVARQELFHIKNKLKILVTGEWIRINPKNVAAHDERNHVNLVFLSNEHQPLVLEKDDRRYTIVWTPANLPANFYVDVGAEIAAGGIAALHHHLLNLDLGDFNEHTKPPMTEAKRDLIEVSLGSVERFVDEWLAGETPYPFVPCDTTQLYEAYAKWCRRQGIGKPREHNQFSNSVAKRPGWEKTHKDKYDNAFYNGPTKRFRCILPSAQDIERAAKISPIDYRRKPEQTQAQYHTDCFFAFQAALGALE